MLRFYRLTYEKFDIGKFERLNKHFKIPMSKRIGILSKGMKTKLALMLTLGISPGILLLDEPASGLDPSARNSLNEMVLDEVAQYETTVVISSHNLNDMERICDRIALIGEGKVKFQGSIDELKQKVRKFRVVFNKEVKDSLFRDMDVLNVKRTGRLYWVVCGNYSSEFPKKLENNGADLIEEAEMGLEEIFVYLYGGEGINEENN